MGENGHFFLAAAERLAGQPAPENEMDEVSLAAFLKAIYPEKAGFLSPETLSSLIAMAPGDFNASPPSPTLLNLHLGTMFVFGTGYPRDHLLLALCGKETFDLTAITPPQFQMILTRALASWKP